jgi:hypothetical protein
LPLIKAPKQSEVDYLAEMTRKNQLHGTMYPDGLHWTVGNAIDSLNERVYALIDEIERITGIRVTRIDGYDKDEKFVKMCYPNSYTTYLTTSPFKTLMDIRRKKFLRAMKKEVRSEICAHLQDEVIEVMEKAVAKVKDEPEFLPFRGKK